MTNKKMLQRLFAWLAVIVLLFTPLQSYASNHSENVTDLNQVNGFAIQTVNFNTLELSWNPVSGAQSYEIYYSTSPFMVYKRLKSLKDTYFSFKKAKCGENYSFKVFACTKYKGTKYYSPESNTIEGMTILDGKPELSITKTTYNKATLKWSKVQGAKKYKIYFRNSTNQDWKLLKTVGGTSFNHTKLETGLDYYYYICPIRDMANGKDSNIVVARPRLGDLTGLKVSSGKNQLRISWKKVPGAKEYIVCRSEEENGTYEEISKINKTSYIDKNVTSGKEYFYYVYATANNTQSNVSERKKGTVKISNSGTKLEGKPELSITKTTYNSAALKWTKVQGAKKYKIYYRNLTTQDWKLLKTVTSTSFNHTKLETGLDYYYYICPIRDLVNGEDSNIVVAKPRLGELTGLNVTSGENQIKISWNKLLGAEKYVICRSEEENGTYEEIATINQTSYVDKNVTAGKEYFYYVYATANNTQSNVSERKKGTAKSSGTSNPGTDPSKSSYIEQVVKLVNEERAKEGLQPLVLDNKVNAAANVRAKELEKKFDHTRPDGSRCFTALNEQNCSYRTAGENIAYGYPSPEAVVKGWMNSEGHRANIMSPYFQKIGVGYYKSGTTYWVQLFTN